jgi:hypothetical protein
MALTLDYTVARQLLEEAFTEATTDIPHGLRDAIERVIASRTQAYREVLIGCCLARLLNPAIDVRRPYVQQGESAYNGRTLDEQVINPFLQHHEIPASRGPFLSVFRRNATFTEEFKAGLRDRAGFDALLVFLNHLEQADSGTARLYLTHLLSGLIRLRDASNIALLRIQRLSLEQYQTLITGLLRVPSGGRVPVLLAVAMFQTLKEAFGLDWHIEWQGINVSDRASDVAGDITIRSGDSTFLAIEITERPIDRSRVEATFRAKILVHQLQDYMFLHGDAAPADDAQQLAARYFAQGHDIIFIHVRDWLHHGLATVGSRARQTFSAHLLDLLGARDVPASLKLQWNEQLRRLIST